MPPLELFVGTLHLTDPALIEALLEAGIPLHLDQGELLIRVGERPAVVPFLLEGIVRGYLFDEDGREITDCFAVQPGHARRRLAAALAPLSGSRRCL